jgi:hypothetical protein
MQGTFNFMVINVLEGKANEDPNHQHCADHDLESFYWLLIFLPLRHTHHNLGPLMYGQLFDSKVMQYRAADAKRNLVEKQSLLICKNAPFTHILHVLTALVKNQVASTSATQRAFLDVLDRALELELPLDDRAIPFVRPDTRKKRRVEESGRQSPIQSENVGSPASRSF